MSTPSLEVRLVEKMVVMSDLHLGEEECILNPYKGPGGKPVPKRNENISKLKEMIKNEGRINELILLGDFLDLSLASLEEAYKNARAFFSVFNGVTSIDQITYIPGNHDHHVWVQLVEQKEVVEELEKGETPAKKEELTQRSVRTTLNGTFLEKFLENLLPPETPSKKLPALEVAYPDIMRRIGNQPNDPVYYFTHGHYLEDFFTPITKFLGLKGKVSLVDLEAFNCAWLEAGWYHMGQAGRLGDLMEGVYEAIANHDEEAAKNAAETIFELYIQRFMDVPEKEWYEWIEEFLRKPGKETIKNLAIAKFLKGRRKEWIEGFLKWRIKRRLLKMNKFASLVGTDSEELKEKIKDHISQYVEPRPLKDLTFVFGHTHKTTGLEKNGETKRIPVPINDTQKDCFAVNTGAWLVTKEEDKKNVGFFVIDKDGPHWKPFFVQK